MKTRCLLISAVILASFGHPLFADDWPQWRGPDRTGVSREKALLKEWPKAGPKLLWTYKETGIGFSGPAIVGERLYIMGARKDPAGKESEYLLALDVAKGQQVWATRIGPIFTFGGNSWGDGPRGTPTVDEDQVYALGGQGDLICVNAKTGVEKWRKSLRKDLGGKYMEQWGYCESPLVDGEQLLCTPGGPGGSLAALNKKTGAILWRSKELKDQATYGSMVAADLGGVRQYVHVTYAEGSKGGHVVGVAARDGKLLWSFTHKKYQTAVAATPIVHKNQVYVSAGYGAGCNLLNITGASQSFQAEDLYKSRAQRVMKNQHGGIVLVGDYVYGFSDNSGWVCQQFKSGTAAWTERNKLDKGSLTCAAGQLYLYGQDEGTAVLIDASADGWKEHGRFTIPEKSKLPETRKSSSAAKIWTHPVVANGRLYLRDQELLFCYDVRAQ